MTFGKMLNTFSFWLSSNLSKQKSLTAEILGIYFIRTIVPIKYMPIISAVGLFRFDKFEDVQNEKVFTKPYFRKINLL